MKWEGEMGGCSLTRIRTIVPLDRGQWVSRWVKSAPSVQEKGRVGGGSESERVSGWGERKHMMREGLSRGLEADSKYVVEGVLRLRSTHRLCSCKLKVKMR